MKAIIKTSNPATLSFAQAVLRDARIESFVLDTHISAMEGGIVAFPRRLMVVDEDWEDAVEALEAAELGGEVYRG